MILALLLGCTSGGDLSAFVPKVKFQRLDLSSIDFEHIEVDFVRQPALLDEWLRDAHPTRVADRNQKRFHADNVSTL